MSATEVGTIIPEEPSLGRQVARGAAWSVAASALAAPMNLVATGITLEQLGAGRYGLWAILSVFAGYLRLGDLGLSAAFARRVAELLSAGDYQRIGRGLSSVAWVVLVSGSALVGIAWMVRDLVLFDLFSVTPRLAAEARDAYGTVLIAVIATLLSPVFASLLVGAQRTDREKQISGLSNIVLSSGIIMAVVIGGGVRGIALAQLSASLFGLICYVFAAKRTLPQVSLSPFGGFDLREAWSLFRFGAGLQLTQAAMNVMTQTDRIVLSHFHGPGVAGIYDVALKALYSMQSASHHLIAPLYAAAARLNAEGRAEDMSRWVIRTGRIFSAVAGPAYGLVCIGAPVIVEAWIGRPEPRIAATLAIIAAVQATNIGNGPGYYMLLGSGRLGPILKGSLVTAIMGITIALGTVNSIGYYGVVGAHALAVLALIIWVAFCIRRAFGTSLTLQLHLSAVPFAVGAAEGALLHLFSGYAPSTRLATLAMAGALMVPGFLLLWRSGFLPLEDRGLVIRFLPRRLMRRFTVKSSTDRTPELAANPAAQTGPVTE